MTRDTRGVVVCALVMATANLRRKRQNRTRTDNPQHLDESEMRCTSHGRECVARIVGLVLLFLKNRVLVRPTHAIDFDPVLIKVKIKKKKQTQHPPENFLIFTFIKIVNRIIFLLSNGSNGHRHRTTAVSQT